MYQATRVERAATPPPFDRYDLALLLMHFNITTRR